MRDLENGERRTLQGSRPTPYSVQRDDRRDGVSVYSCSCPAWRFQQKPIEARTCKHLAQVRGQELEDERVLAITSGYLACTACSPSSRAWCAKCAGVGWTTAPKQGPEPEAPRVAVPQGGILDTEGRVYE